MKIMILIITPENTWNPWKPVTIKNNAANAVGPNGLPYNVAPSVIN